MFTFFMGFLNKYNILLIIKITFINNKSRPMLQIMTPFGFLTSIIQIYHRCFGVWIGGFL